MARHIDSEDGPEDVRGGHCNVGCLQRWEPLPEECRPGTPCPPDIAARLAASREVLARQAAQHRCTGVVL